jgi:hypothetical protein
VGRQHILARSVSQIYAIQPIRQIVPTPFSPSPDKFGGISSGFPVVTLIACGVSFLTIFATGTLGIAIPLFKRTL